MRISVIIPTYNRPDYLPLALASLASQNFPQADFEVIVIDDGSKEDCQKIIDNFKQKINISLIKLNHSGVCRARNAGIKSAQRYFLLL